MVKENRSVVGKLLCQIDGRVPIADSDDADDKIMVDRSILVAWGWR